VAAMLDIKNKQLMFI